MITHFFLEDGTFFVSDSVTGRATKAEPDSAWSQRARDPLRRPAVIVEMLAAPQSMNMSPLDPRGMSTN